MAKRYKVFSGKFVAGMVIYAVVFLALVGFGLSFFWKFIDAYECSRPINTVKAYMNQLTVEQMCAASDDLYARVDQNLQSRDQFDQVIRDAVVGEFSYAKKSSESTEERQVYVIRSEKQPVGQYAITAGEEDRFGFRVWQVTEESFDFSYLLGASAGITVPAEYQVRVNGNLLDSNYITQQNIEYTALEGFYDDYQLPVMVSYIVDSLLGEIVLEVTDVDGNAVTITEETDLNSLLPECSAEKVNAVTEFANAFIGQWVIFSASTNDTKAYNYHNIRPYLSSDGVLEQLLYTALDGFTYAQSNSDTLQNVTINRITPVETDKYVCDVTYIVRTVGRQGPVDTTSNMKLMIATESGSLKLKSMERY